MRSKEEALLRIKELGLKPGDTIYTILRHVSKSGMTRRISLLFFKAECEWPSKEPTGTPFQLDGLAEALGVAKSKRVTRHDSRGSSYQSREEGLVVGGCGMDMGFDLVYRLGRTLYPDGFAYARQGLRPDGTMMPVGRSSEVLTKDFIEDLVKQGWKFPGGRNSSENGWDRDGGYAFEHRWL